MGPHRALHCRVPGKFAYGAASRTLSLATQLGTVDAAAAAGSVDSLDLALHQRLNAARFAAAK